MNTKSRDVFAALFASAIVFAGVQSSVAQSDQLRISLGLPEGNALYQPLVNFGETLRTNGIDNRVYSMQLLPFHEAHSGVRDKLLDIALVSYAFAGQAFSEINLVSDLAMLTTTGAESDMPSAVMTGAMTEYVLLNCSECLDQLRAQNQVMVSGLTTSRYGLLCRKPTKTLTEIEGKRIRSVPGYLSRLVEFVGGIPVIMSGTELYEALNHGVVDCSVNAPADLIGGRFIDVTLSVLLGFPGSVNSGFGYANINLDTWRSLTVEQRETLLVAGAHLSAEGMFGYEAEDAKAIKLAQEEGLDVFEADESTRARIHAFVEEDLSVVRRQGAELNDLDNVDSKIAIIRNLIDKWKRLTNSTDLSAADLSQLYWREIYSRIDPETQFTE